MYLLASKHILSGFTYLGIGARPLCTARCGSLLICESVDVAESGVASVIGVCDPETVIFRIFGI
jgi:hypothetical protein